MGALEGRVAVITGGISGLVTLLGPQILKYLDEKN